MLGIDDGGNGPESCRNAAPALAGTGVSVGSRRWLDDDDDDDSWDALDFKDRGWDGPAKDACPNALWCESGSA